MESRKERHSTPKPQRPIRKKISSKAIGGLAIAGAACLVLGAGAFYLLKHNAPTKEQVAVATPSPQATSAGGSKPTLQPTPTVSPASTAPTASMTPTASDKPSGNGAQVKLAFVGDVLLASKVEDLLKQKGYDYPYTHVKDLLSAPDYTVANLETSVTTRGAAQNKDYVYRSSPLALPALKASGIDLVNLANNHVMDYGEEGLLDTMAALDTEGFQRVGAGKDAEEAYRPVIVEKQGIKIAFLGFSRVVPDGTWKAAPGHPGVAETYNYKPPVEAIQKAKEKADLVVVITHWGVERTDQPDKNQKELAHRYIDAGADLIIGGHPHVLQGFEQYKGKWIAYSLGNFIFTTNETQKTWETVIMEAACSKEAKCDIQLTPILTKFALPTPMNAEDGAKLFQRLSQISFGAQVNAQGKLTKK